MQNYKVEVKNHGEGMEAQDLFLEIGFKKSTLLEDGYPKYVVAGQFSLTGGKESGGAHISFVGTNYKKITLPELRAMVSVQKYEELAKKYDGVKTKQLPNGIQFKKSKTSVTIYPSTGTIVSDVCGKINVLKKAGIGKLDYELNKHFSVITPKQKEYLVKTDTGYVLQVLSDVVDGHGGIIEVPDGVEVATENKEGLIYFWKNNGNDWFSRSHKKWKKLGSMQHHIEKLDHKIIWQRKESLNDQVASAEEYRQSFAKQNGIPIFLERQKFIQPEELPFVGDEPTGVDGTLAERQAQYGNFSEVAEMTQQLLTVMGQYGYEYLPDMHKEALHMICSKMARIVNGDHNHLDSWHDIGGYAKLIENNIK